VFVRKLKWASCGCQSWRYIYCCQHL